MAAAAGGDAGPLGPVEGQDDHAAPAVLRRFELVQKLGHSPWGVTWRAVDKRSRRPVALKKLYGAFSSRRRAQMAYREVCYLERLAGDDNIVQLQNVLLAEPAAPDATGATRQKAQDLYLVFELWEADLFNAIRVGAIEPKHHGYIIAQVLAALSRLHALGIVHRDVKPSNILIDGSCRVKLCDLGHARSVVGTDAPVGNEIPAGSPMTDYLGSRWYRAPESLLGTTRLTTAADIWAVGCVLGELLCGEPILQGTDTTNQLQLIVQITGLPSASEIEEIAAPLAALQLGARVLGKQVPRAISEVFRDATAEALDFVRMCLNFSPSSRFTAAKALKHPFVLEYFHECLELRNADLRPEPLFLDDNIVHSVKEYRHVLIQNVVEREKHMQKLLSSNGRHSSAPFGV